MPYSFSMIPPIQACMQLLLSLLAVLAISEIRPAHSQSVPGSTLASIVSPRSGADSPHAMALQPDGKIVLAGTCHTGTRFELCVWRRNPDLTPDSSFNGSGMLITSLDTGNQFFIDLALLPDGRILLAGTCLNAAATVARFCLMRLHPNGSLDTSFNGTGSLLLTVGPDNNDRASSLSLLPDGKFLVAGTCYLNPDDDFCVVRLLANGSLDTSFNGSGKRFVPVIGSDHASSMRVQPDGRILIGGTCFTPGNNDFCVVRLNSNGSTLDSSFNGTGKLVLPIGPLSNNDIMRAMALQPDGKILLAGQCDNGSYFGFCVARLHGDGSLDAQFHGPGPSSADGKFIFAVGTQHANARAMALQLDGKILLAGHCGFGSNNSFCIVRLNPDGSFDQSFDGDDGVSDGQLFFSLTGPDDRSQSIVLQADGHILAAGSCGAFSDPDLCLLRLHGGPFGAQHCRLDVDGDGQILATKDMLILTRVSLGMTGSAVTNGISFASHATRTTWPSIRDYLVTQCGMTLP